MIYLQLQLPVVLRWTPWLLAVANGRGDIVQVLNFSFDTVPLLQRA